MIRLLIGTTSMIVRAGLESLFGSDPEIEAVGWSADFSALAQQVENLTPDVLLIESEQSDDETIQIVTSLSSLQVAPAIVILTEGSHENWEAEAIRSGARAILPREATTQEIVAAVKAAAAGLIVLHPDGIHSLLPHAPSTRAQPALSNQSLTPREIEVLSMLAEGLGNKEIAWRLHISEHTVKFHISAIFTKLNAASRTEAVTIGIRQGLILL